MPKHVIDYDSYPARGVFLAGVLAGALRELLRQPESEALQDQARRALDRWYAYTRER
jgi:hypothetical protein